MTHFDFVFVDEVMEDKAAIEKETLKKESKTIPDQKKKANKETDNKASISGFRYEFERE